MSVGRKQRIRFLCVAAVSASVDVLVCVPSASEPIEVQGQILSGSQESAALSALGVGSIDPYTEIVAFDIEPAVTALCQNPNRFLIRDDGIPVSGPHNSGGPFTGVDVDTAGGLSTSGAAIFASEAPFASFGPEIAPTSNTLGACLDPYIDGLFGDTESEGFPANVLGPPDAFVVFECNVENVGGFTSIGSGGILEIGFPDEVANSNAVGQFDLFLFDAGGAGDNAVFTVDAVPRIIEAEPKLALNPPGTTHDVVAQLNGVDPSVGVQISFEVVDGPNAGVSGSRTTDSSSSSTFSYAGTGGPGVDLIVASFVEAECGLVESDPALKFWDGDCNENQVPDTCDISCDGFGALCEEFDDCGMSLDVDEDGTPDECPVNVLIDIKPGSDPNSIQPWNEGVIPVAILGSEDLDVNQIDRTTLAFGPSAAAPVHAAGGHLEDVDSDGQTDLLSHYEATETGIAFGDESACVTGELLDGTPIKGCDSVRTVPACGLGFEIAIVLAPMLAAFRRRKASFIE